MAMTVDLPALERAEAAAPRAPATRLRRYARPMLGLLLRLALRWHGDRGLARLVQRPAGAATHKNLRHHHGACEERRADAPYHRDAERVAVGFGIGVVAGTLLGAISGYWGLARQLLDPTVQALRAIPRSPGCRCSSCGSAFSKPQKSRDRGRRVLSGLSRRDGRDPVVDRKIVEVGRTFRLSGPAMIRRILLPAVLPAYVVALRVGLGLGWMFVVAAELMGASEGSAISCSTASSSASPHRSSRRS